MKKIKHFFRVTYWLFIISPEKARAYEKKYLNVIFALAIGLVCFGYSHTVHAAYLIDSSSSYFGGYGTTSLTSATTTIAGADAVVIGCDAESNPQTTLSITDTLGTNFVTSSFATDAGSYGESIVVSGIPFSGNDHITCHIGGSPAYSALYVYEVSGLKNVGGNLVEDFATSSARSDNVMGANVTSAYPNDFIFMSGITQDSLPTAITGCSPIGACYPDASLLGSSQAFYGQYGSFDAIQTNNFTQGWAAYGANLSTMAAFECNGACVGSGPPPPPPGSDTVEFVFPQTSGALIPDFTNWKIGLSGPTGTLITGQISYQVGNQWTFVNKIYSDSFSYNMGTDNFALLPISKSNPLWGNCSESNIPGCDQQWIAEIYLNGSNASSAEAVFNVGVTTSTIQLTSSTQDVGPFLYNPFQSSPSNEYVSVASSVAAQFASSTGCPAPTGLLDIGGGLSYALCSTINLLFIPGPVGMEQISSTISSLESVPPYSWFFQVNGEIESSAQTTSTATGIVFNDIPAGFGRSTTITVLAADPTTNSYLNTVTRYSPWTLLEILWNAALFGFIFLILWGFYKMVL